MLKVEKFNYGRTRSNRDNTIGVTVGDLDLYFSYDTVVAFRSPEHGLTVCENVWSVTTGKHLNWIDPDGENRVDHKLFDTMLSEALELRSVERS